jgi:hypothetical protein
MADDPRECRQRALMCANRAANRTSPAARQRSADLAVVWLMLAVQLEGQGRPRPTDKGIGPHQFVERSLINDRRPFETPNADSQG